MLIFIEAFLMGKLFPKENIFIVGTVNQVAHPDSSLKTMIKLTQKK